MSRQQQPPINRALKWTRELGKRLHGRERSLLYALATHTNADLIAWPSERTLAVEAAVAYSTVRVLLPQLVKCGALAEIEPRRGTDPARYQFTLCAYDGLPAKLEPRPDRKPKPEPARDRTDAERAALRSVVTGRSAPPGGAGVTETSAPPGGAVDGASAPPGGAEASAPPGDTSAPPGERSAPPGGAEVTRSNQEAPTTGGAFLVGESDDRGGSAGKPAAARGSEQQTEPSSPRTAPAPGVPAGRRPVAVAVGSPAPTGGPTMAEALVGPCPRQRERPPSLGQLTPAERWHVLAVGRTDPEHPDRAVSYHCGTTLPKARQWITAVERDAAPERAAG